MGRRNRKGECIPICENGAAAAELTDISSKSREGKNNIIG